MSTTAMDGTREYPFSKLAGAGALAGLVGGVLFGAMMAIMGMLPMVGMLIGVENSLVGFLVHMLISAALGVAYGVVAGRLSLGSGAIFVSGLVYGFIWWVLGALILMPLMLGMNSMVLAIGQTQWMSLIGHLLYGVVAALVFFSLRDRLG